MKMQGLPTAVGCNAISVQCTRSRTGKDGAWVDTIIAHLGQASLLAQRSVVSCISQNATWLKKYTKLFKMPDTLSCRLFLSHSFSPRLVETLPFFCFFSSRQRTPSIKDLSRSCSCSFFHSSKSSSSRISCSEKNNCRASPLPPSTPVSMYFPSDCCYDMRPL